ncbi:glycine/betaine ABC transporter substrate-binding protein [Epidermidibacterium keratini]|uniref:Glycine/betaine ABC transporter substrate-binding protein n=1 Tax=Epidermidibacterium keratini TaxID=1891644 RepID=A0A7L4YHY8_9ACTN|nr:glycine betaine ABC transporter substrate-binding protein [Epidermidibacterium keratini]QHB98911.1 glycine/betaine ABC transporter substrate-binding protein [Epidermidibacterium keratini]
MTRRSVRTALLAVGMAITLAVAGCSGDTDVSGGGSGDAASGGSLAEDYDLEGASLTVGSKEFTENRILGQITIAALQAAGADVTDKTGISGTDTVRAALDSGEIDMYWEYTGTGWVNILGNTSEQLPDDLYTAVKDADAANGVTWIGPAKFNNTYAIAVKSDFAKENDLETISDAATYLADNPDAQLCAASEFINRDDGLPGLEAAYGMKFGGPVEVDLNLIYTQLGKDCDFGEVFATDARVKSNDLVVLEDDKKFIVPYVGALTVKSDIADEYPDIDKMFADIAEKLDDETMIDLNGKVDLDGEKEADVAKQWLQENGYID